MTLYDSRSFKEETETAQELIPPAFLNRHKINNAHEHITFIYFAASTTDHVVNQEDEASDEMHWFSAQDLDNAGDILPRIKTYAQAALDAYKN